MTETLVEAPPIIPPDAPAVAVSSEPEDAPRTVQVNIKYSLAGAKPKTKFTRDNGNFKQDGSKLLDEYDETFTEDECPNTKGHDLNKIIGARHGHKLVECLWCGAVFESKEPSN